MDSVPSIRIRHANSREINPSGDYVLYWMIAARRTQWNFGLQRAIDWAQKLKKPILVLEALRCGYEWASDRLHHFVIQGMADNAKQFAKHGVAYYPYVEPKTGAGRGLLESLAKDAAVVVSDEFPCFFLPRMIASASQRLPVRCELVDSNGLLPLEATDRVFLRAFDFRRFLQKHLKPHLEQIPKANPLARRRLPHLAGLPTAALRRWKPADPSQLLDDSTYLSALSIDHSVGVTSTVGGSAAGRRLLKRFLDQRLARYPGERNQPEQEVTSGLSPYLHFGHISVHHVFAETMARENWSIDMTADKANGSSTGWWGTSPAAESFLDELITWREVGYNMCAKRDDYDQYSSLPDWAQDTLRAHAKDPREYVYSYDEFETSRTHDQLWNAAQRQLVREGRIHNYLRMLWGKKVVEWTASPQEALDILIELNNKFALDGRNPNSYSGILWCLGRYDRPWGPERPIFGRIRFMSSANTARKVRVKDYIEAYAPETTRTRSPL